MKWNELPLMMVRKHDDMPWQGPFPAVRQITGVLAFQNGHFCECFSKFKPYTAPTRRQMNHAEIFAALRLGAVIRNENVPASNYWDADNDPREWEICNGYTGAELDVWQKMEVTDDQH